MMGKTQSVIFFIALAMLTSNAMAYYWSSSVDTNSTHWSIYRESNNLSFNLSSSVKGKISPVEFHGRTLGSYQSYYEEIKANDVRLRERTSALEGSFKSAEEIRMHSIVYPGEIEISIYKPAGSKLFTIKYQYEQWPVLIKASRAIEYSGKQINDRDFEGNNGDFVGSSFLYNSNLSKSQNSVIWLQRMNATVLATNDSIISAEFKPTRYLGYQIRANSTGIADFSYRMRDYNYDVKHQSYPALSEGQERYYGAYGLSQRIEMRSLFDAAENEDGWFPSCYIGWDCIMPSDQIGYGASAKEVFDCTCSMVAAKM